MKLYEKIKAKNIEIPHRFSMNLSQILDIYDNSKGKADAMAVAFEFGYMQGVRAERAGKAGNIE